MILYYNHMNAPTISVEFVVVVVIVVDVVDIVVL